MTNTAGIHSDATEDAIRFFVQSLKSVPVEFCLLAVGAEKTMASENNRENRQDVAAHLKRTTEQRVYFVVGYKHSRGVSTGTTLSAGALAAILTTSS